MTSTKYVKTLREQVLSLIGELSEMIPNDRGDLTELSFFIEQYPAHDLMQGVIQYVLPWEKQIKSRDDDFFFKNKKIFGDLPEDKVDYFSDMWKSHALDKDDRSVVWQYFDAFVACAHGYKKMQ